MKGERIKMPRSLPVAEAEIIRQKLSAGLGPADLVGLPELGGRTLSSIYWIIRHFRLRKRVRKSPVFLSERKQRKLDEYLLGPGKDEPARVVAEKLKVSERQVYPRRLALFGKPEKPAHRIDPEKNALAGKLASLNSAKSRAVLYASLCVLRTSLASTQHSLEERVCKTCGESWYACLDFYYQRSNSSKTGAVVYCTNCKVCEAEVRLLKRLGKTADEISDAMANLYTSQPAVSKEELQRRMWICATRGSQDPTVSCQRCKCWWHWSPHFFYRINHNGQAQLINTCLACKVQRRYHHK